MPKKSKRQRRPKPGPATEKMWEARRAGKVISAGTGAAIADLLDTGIWLWFLEKSPLSIHLLGVAAYHRLEVLGKDSGKGPVLKARVGEELFTRTYDFLRHGSTDLNAGIDFPPGQNTAIFFDALSSFERIFDHLTIPMLTFRAYLSVHPELHTSKTLCEHASECLPEGLAIKEARSFDRKTAFNELSRRFLSQCELRTYLPPGLHLP